MEGERRREGTERREGEGKNGICFVDCSDLASSQRPADDITGQSQEVMADSCFRQPLVHVRG